MIRLSDIGLDRLALHVHRVGARVREQVLTSCEAKAGIQANDELKGSYGG
jgi:hypothetical protein